MIYADQSKVDELTSRVLKSLDDQGISADRRLVEMLAENALTKDIYFFSQNDIPMSEDISEMDDKVRIIAGLPKSVNSIEMYVQHVSMTQEEIREEIGRLLSAENKYVPTDSLVMTLKESKVKQAVRNLYEKIYAVYKAQADALGLELNASNFSEEVATPLMYRDLCPGSYCIQFDVFTQRRLIKKD